MSATTSTTAPTPITTQVIDLAAEMLGTDAAPVHARRLVWRSRVHQSLARRATAPGDRAMHNELARRLYVDAGDVMAFRAPTILDAIRRFAPRSLQ